MPRLAQPSGRLRAASRAARHPRAMPSSALGVATEEPCKQAARRAAPGRLEIERHPPSRRSPDWDQADFLFFLSSSTSVNSASTTSSLGLLLGASPPPGAAPPWAWAYIASPSFIEACANVLVLDPMRSAL